VLRVSNRFDGAPFVKSSEQHAPRSGTAVVSCTQSDFSGV
jgi:hypothetical protein